MPSVILFVIQILLFGAIAVCLHYLSEHYGIAPLVFYVAGIMGVFNLIEITTLFVVPAPGIVIRPGGHVFVPIILLIVLFLYITSGTRTARLTILGLIGIDLLILSALVFLWLYMQVRDPGTLVQGLFAEADVVTPLLFRGVLASIIAFAANMFVITIVYQGIKNAFPAFPENLTPGVALLIALWVDSALYNLLAFFGTDRFLSGLPGDVLMKTLAGLILAPLAGWYLTRVAPNLTHYLGADDRLPLDILFGRDRSPSRLDQLENELQVSRAIYEQIVGHIDEVFWLADIQKGRLLYLSPSFEKLTGKPAEYFYKHPQALLDLVHPDDRDADIVKQVLRAPETEFRLLGADGDTRWVRNRSFPILSQDRQAVRYAGLTEDVTLRREVRTQAFALELAREKERVLHRFVRDASHDLRTPLTALLLKLDLMGKITDATRQQALRQEMREVTEHLNHLIDDLFTLSRIESQEKITHTALDFNAIVRQVVDEHQILAQNKHLNLVTDLMEGTIPLAGHQEQLTRLVANLVENAIHYTHQGAITVRTLVRDAQAVLEVADTGMGIPAADLDLIFERFYRADDARTVRYEGTGLGLAISKAVVEQHSGTIAVQSTVGLGTLFQVTLPTAA